MAGHASGAVLHKKYGRKPPEKEFDAGKYIRAAESCMKPGYKDLDPHRTALEELKAGIRIAKRMKMDSPDVYKSFRTEAESLKSKIPEKNRKAMSQEYENFIASCKADSAKSN
jgi:hypothetical protein